MNHSFLKKENYEIVWQEFPQGANCLKEAFVPLFFQGFKGHLRAGQTVIHFGCGKGFATKSFLAKGLHVTLVDVSFYSLDGQIRNLLHTYQSQVQFIPGCLWQLPAVLKSAYWIYCCHVLEHIPESYLDSALEKIAERMRFGGYFSIALKEREARPHVHPFYKEKLFWQEKLSTYFTIVGEDAIADEAYFNCKCQKKL